MRKVLVTVAAVAIAATGCGGGSSKASPPKVSSSPTPSAAEATPSGPALIDGKYTGYALGSNNPKCADAVAFWGHDLTGPGTGVHVSIAGPATVTVNITLKAGGTSTKAATIPSGNDVYDFHVPAVKRTDIKRVQIDTSGSPELKGGTCSAPFGDTDIPDPSAG